MRVRLRHARLPLFTALALLAVAAPAGRAADLAALADPRAGSETGGVFPGAAVPFGMVQLSPNTNAAHGGGYRYSHPRTWGFGMTHLSGTGCPAMGDVVALPTTGPVKTVSARAQKATFSHAAEAASPGYYAVTLQPAGIRAELSATTRTGWARLAYPPTRQAHVVIDPGANFRGAHDVHVRIVGDRTVEGSVGSWGYWNACPALGPNRYTVYFSMTFDRPFTAFGTGNGATLHRRQRSADGTAAGAYVSFDTRTDRRPVVSKTGISYVDPAGARRNLAVEGGSGFDFEATVAHARAAWDLLLGRIAVSGEHPALQRTFYSALYHTLQYPSVLSDADGRYVGFDDRVHRVAAGHEHFTNFSMWDTYRSADQVLDLVAPEAVGDMMTSLLDDGDQGGWLPKWPFAHFYTNEMIGDPADNVLVDADLKGLLAPQDVQRAFAALLHNATDVPDPARTPFEGRTGLEDYLNRGFVPYRAHDDDRNGASIGMEYAVNDCALALMARHLGGTADWRYLLRRAKRYRSTIDSATGTARPRTTRGVWRTQDAASGVGFKEGSGAQYTWLVPQDVGGLARALGGTSAAIARLDAFFDYPAVAADPAGTRAVWHGPTRYTPGNELDLQAPYLYDYLGQPWKTQTIVHAAERRYTSAPNGLPNSDDLGTMSAWYVLSALGLFPVTGGDDHYALTSPLFEHAVITPPRSFYPGGPIVIDAPGAGAGRQAIQGVTLDGRPLTTSVVDHGALRTGAHLVFALGTTPSPTWATGAQTPASACSADPASTDVRLRIAPSSAGRVRALVRNAGDAAATDVAVRLRLPGGWWAHPSAHDVSRLAPGRTIALVWRLHAPGGDHSGPLRADASWAGPGGRGRALRTFATGTAVDGAG